jgi:hypothetical protein
LLTVFFVNFPVILPLCTFSVAPPPPPPIGIAAKRKLCGLAFLLLLALSGCDSYNLSFKDFYEGKTNDGATDGSGPLLLTSIEEIEDYLAAATADPVPLPVNITLDTAGWTGLLNAIDTAGKDVELDLSACDITGMTGTLGEFDPNNLIPIGKEYIVSLDLPDAATGIKVGTSSEPTFRYFTTMESITGDNMVTIGNYTFKGCDTLAAATFPKATTIGSCAFYGCIGLQTLNLPRAESIGSYAFDGCIGLTTLNLNAATDIGGYTFSGCTNLSSLSLSAATDIDEYAFNGCIGLTTLNLPAAGNIGNFAFRDTGGTALTVTLGNTAPALENNMFHQSVSVAKTVTVKVPAGATGYGSSPPNTSAVCWGNGFRGGGWNGSAFTGGTVNSYISLTIETLP